MLLSTTSTEESASGNDSAASVAADDDQNIYVVGTTTSSNFPTVNALQPAIAGNSDAFVAKISSNGTAVYVTYLGGGGTENGYNVAADQEGNTYVSGNTSSDDLPVVNAIQPVRASTNAPDLFVGKINSDGSAFEFLSYLGGSGDESQTGRSGSAGGGLALDATGVLYIAGTTRSTDFPTVNAFAPFIRPDSYGVPEADIFIAKIDLASPYAITQRPALEPNPALVGEPVIFSAMATDTQAQPLTYMWSFGDGASDLSSNVVSHAYATNGIFHGTVTVSSGTNSTVVPFTAGVSPSPIATKLAISETYPGKILKKCFYDDATGSNVCVAYKGARFSISEMVTYSLIPTNQFDRGTVWRVQVGGFEYTGALGFDPKYLPGKTSAKFTLGRVLDETAAKPKLVTLLTVQFKWTATRLSANISGTALVEDDVAPILVDQFINQPSAVVSNTVASRITLGSYALATDIPYKATIKTAAVTTGGNLQTNSTVKISGRLSLVAP